MNRRSVSKLNPFFQMGNQAICLGFVCSLLLIPTTLRASTPDRPPSSHAQEGQPSHEANILAARVAESIRTITRERSASIVRVRCHDGHGEIVGTGFYLDPTGTIITLAEIVQGAQEITVEQSGDGGTNKQLPATLTAIDPRSGVAFLKVTTEAGSDAFLPPLTTITNSPELTPVIGIGYPREGQATPALGMITGSKNHEGEIFFCVTHLTASLPLSAGEGGSPILDLSGNLLGIVIAGNTQLGTCTILPSAAIEHLHHNLLRYGSINPGWVGAVVEIAAVPQNDSRTRIVSVAPGSPAEAAGIRPGDMLLMLGKHPIHTPEDVLDASFYLSGGEEIRVTVLRKGTPQDLTLQCGTITSPGDDLDASATAAPAGLLGNSAH